MNYRFVFDLSPSSPAPLPNAPIETARSIQSADPCPLANSASELAATTPNTACVPFLA
ncbi:MAG: hypothetical protein PHQ40_20215 [Anaerolineaceae bacterium]|nr:hypothetical protein [Anaerolineaceae bacterium]